MFILIKCIVLTSLSQWLLTVAESTEDDNQALRPDYRNPRFSQLISKEKYTRAGQEYVTDQLLDQTESTMSPSRRGDKDSASSRTKRFTHMGIRWSKTDLTYNISKYPHSLEKPVTDNEIRKAFAVWSRVTPVTFTQKSDGPVDIDIRFESGDHGDSEPFNSTILAHSSGPFPYGGYVHFNDEAEWTINSHTGIDLFKVAAHEFGHTLGLDHSEEYCAIMFKEYKRYHHSFKLHSDDINGIQALYGKNITDSQGSEEEGLSKDAKVDTMFLSAKNDTYVIKGIRWSKTGPTYKISKYPRSLEMQVTDKVIRKAFAVWSRVTPLTITQMSNGPVDIDIRFESGDHGDSDPFGPNTLAHSSGPLEYGGYVHFNDDVAWTINSHTGVNLIKVAAHEFGHTLGLDHSEVFRALMYKDYNGYDHSFELDSDDINGIQALYGKKRTDSQGSEEEGLCKDAKVDTMFLSAKNDTYVIKGSSTNQRTG